MVAGLNAVRARLGGRSVWRARHRRGRPRPTKRRPRSSGSPSGWHHALVAAAGTTTSATTTTTSTAARSATFGRAVRPGSSSRCIRSTKGAGIVASLRSCSVRRRVWSARGRAIDCRPRTGSAGLCNAIACGIDLRRARICTALCECGRSSHQCRCRNCYQRLLHIVLVRCHAPSWMN